MTTHTFDAVINVLSAIGEETRLRIMALLAAGELTVTELTQILGQSQPRVSRHLKILSDAGLVERHREGAWMFYRTVSAGEMHGVSWRGALDGLAASSDRVIARDRDRLEQIRAARAATAAAYFEQNAREWDTVRGLHMPEADIEARMRALVGAEPVGDFVDFGTGTGRMLTLFADAYGQGVGFDLSREMLAIARSNLDAAGVRHAQVRHGDLFSAPVEAASADLVSLHQVLHFLADPPAAVREAARVLRPGGRLLLVDFAPHDLEFLREEHAHRRLGFSDAEVRAWCEAAGLSLEAVETLSPGAGQPNGLTVKIWLARSPRSVRRLRAAVRTA